MQYMGGKTRIAKQIAAVIDQYREPGQLVWDAFCGGLSVSVALSKKGPVLASDACAPLINLYKAVQDGWDPPTEVSKETYMAAKLLPDTDPMKAFCGFGCSFGGKWFGGYGGPSKCHPTGLAIYTRNSLLKLVNITNISLECIDFLSSVFWQYPVLYCDIPYDGVTGYQTLFDRVKFIQMIKEYSKYNHVFISEYSFPLGAIVLEIPSKTKVNAGMSGVSKQATERLFHIPKQS